MGVPPCWKGIWIHTFLTKGLHFEENSADLRLIPGCCEHTFGQAIYEINFFPYLLEEVKPSKHLLLAEQPSKHSHLAEQMGTLPAEGGANAVGAWTVAAASVAGGFVGAAIAAATGQCKRYASTGMMFPMALHDHLLQS